MATRRRIYGHGAEGEQLERVPATHAASASQHFDTDTPCLDTHPWESSPAPSYGTGTLSQTKAGRGADRHRHPDTSVTQTPPH